MRICIDIDLPPHIEKLLRLAGIDVEEVLRRAIEKLIADYSSREFSAITVVKPRDSGDSDKIDWSELIKLYIANPNEVRKRFNASIVRCVDLLARVVKREMRVVCRVDKGSYKVIVIENGSRVYAIRIGSRYCVYRSIDIESPRSAVVDALRKLGLSSDEVGRVLERLASRRSVLSKERLEKAVTDFTIDLNISVYF